MNQDYLPLSLPLLFQYLTSNSCFVSADIVEQNSGMWAALKSMKLITTQMLTAKHELKFSCVLNHFDGFDFVQRGWAYANATYSCSTYLQKAFIEIYMTSQISADPLKEEQSISRSAIFLIILLKK